MKPFKGSWTDGNGKVRKTATWYIRTRDHLGRVQRFAGFKDKRATEQMGRWIEMLIAAKMAGDPPGPELTKWLETSPNKLKRRLVKIGVLDATRAVGAKTLAEHLEDYKASMLARGLTEKQAGQETNRISRITRACKFKVWSDIRPDRVEKYLADLRNGRKNLSIGTTNAYLAAMGAFLRWLIQHRRASENPIACLKPLNVKVDRRHIRCAFEINEIRRLLEVTEQEPSRLHMDGHSRAMLYRLAVETGLRANELRTLTVGSFDWKARTVTVQAAYSKHRRQDELPLRPETVLVLQTFLAGKLPGTRVFGEGRKKLTRHTAEMLKQDLEAAGIPYQDDAGRYRDFHALRHTTGSWLAAMGVHPRIIQAIMRHADVNLTMSRYTHILNGQEAEAIAKLPDLNLGGPQAQKATGTDDVTASKNLGAISDMSHAEQCASVRCGAEANLTGATKNAVLPKREGAGIGTSRLSLPILKGPPSWDLQQSMRKGLAKRPFPCRVHCCELTKT